MEKYLLDIKHKKHRQALTKLRVSNHKLKIETGRYIQSDPIKIVPSLGAWHFIPIHCAYMRFCMKVQYLLVNYVFQNERLTTKRIYVKIANANVRKK